LFFVVFQTCSIMIISVTIKVCYLFIEILLSQNPEKSIIFDQRKAAATNRLDIPSPSYYSLY
jgi:hypothetical protein